MQLGRFNDAIGALEKAIGSGNADNKDFLQLQLAQSAYELGDTERAIHTLQDLKTRSPGNWEAAIPLISSLMQAMRN